MATHLACCWIEETSWWLQETSFGAMYTGLRSPIFVGTFLFVVVVAITFAFAPWQVSEARCWHIVHV